jgi:hypothetical protein
MTCPPVAFTNIRPSLGSPAGGIRVKITGKGFLSAYAGLPKGLLGPPDEYKELVKCGWGDYSMEVGEVLGDELLACMTPPHAVPESLPLRFTLNGNGVHQFDDVRFSYTKSEWLDPSSAPTTGGSVLTVFGYRLRPPPGNSSGAYACLFGDTKVVAEWITKDVCNPLTGVCYAGGLMCAAPPRSKISPSMPEAGVDWARGSLCPLYPDSRVSASSEAGAESATDPNTDVRQGAPLLAYHGMGSNAFDGVGGEGMMWHAKEGMPQWLQIEFVGGEKGFRLPDGSSRVQIAGYGITPRAGVGDALEEAGHALYARYDAPMDFELLGSLDGAAWEVLHSMRHVTDWSQNQEKVFEVPPFQISSAEGPAMRFFRLNVTDVVGRPDGRKVLAISELSLYAPAPALTRVKVSVLVNDGDAAAENLEMFYYRPPLFFDFHPKAGNINGGTEIHVYGSGFIDHPDLRCRFELVYTQATFVSPTEIVCPAPERYVISPQLSLTINGKDFVYCTACVWIPGRCADKKMCSWDCDGASTVAKTVRAVADSAIMMAESAILPREYCAKEDGSCYYERFDSKGCLDEMAFDIFNYYRYPVLQALEPSAGPDTGGSRITVKGVFLQPTTGGHDLFCKLGRTVFRAQYLLTLGEHCIVCTTPSNIPLGYHTMSLSFNGQEWDSKGDVLFYVYAAPFISHVEPVAGVVSYGAFYPGGAYVTIYGTNFLQAARLGRGAAWEVKFGNRYGTVVTSDVSDFELVVTPPVPEGQGKVAVALRLLSVNFPADADVSFTYLDWTFAPGGTCLNNCVGRGNCYTGLLWDSAAKVSRTGPTCNCSAVGLRGFACGQEAVVTHISPRSGPLQGGTLVRLNVLMLELVWPEVDIATDIKCRFGLQAVAATVVSSFECVCISPPLQRNGSVSLEVSFDGGNFWSQQGL